MSDEEDWLAFNARIERYREFCGKICNSPYCQPVAMKSEPIYNKEGFIIGARIRDKGDFYYEGFTENDSV